MQQGQEWGESHKYNSFNSYKGLAYIRHYEAIAAWLRGAGELLPPRECSLDPADSCNFSCGHCNARRYLPQLGTDTTAFGGVMTEAHLLRLLDFLAAWGVRGICIGGGGEPLLNPAVWRLPAAIRDRGMEPAIVTNGALIDAALCAEMMHCRWVGVSIDAGDRETFRKVHGADLFDRVIANLEALIQQRRRSGAAVEVAFKMLLRADNIDSIYAACKLAKKIGVDDFHVRPADLEQTPLAAGPEQTLDIPKIMQIFDLCQAEATATFRVFTVVHKYDRGFRVKHAFRRCCASPLMLQCCADGGVYVCADHRQEARFRLGDHYPEPQLLRAAWGSAAHRDLLAKIVPGRDCGRCTYGEYARQIEEVVLMDKMCLNFP